MDKVKKISGSSDRKLGIDKIPNLLFSMSLPLVIAMVVNGFYYLADAIFVGWAEGAKGIGGLAVVFPIQMLSVSLGSMIGIGTANVVSVELGKKDKGKAAFIIKNSIFFATLLSIILSIVLMLFKTNILYFFGASQEIFKYADEYYSIIIPGFILVLVGFLEANTIRAEGNAKLAGILMVLGVLLNVGFNTLFIFGFKMGVAGAALGTVVSRFIVLVLSTCYYAFKKSVVDIFTKGWALSFGLFKKILFLGLGPFLNQFGFALLAMVMNLSLTYYGSVNDLSVYGVVSRIHIFVTMPFFGLAQGFQTIIAYNFGAQKYERIKKTIIFAVIYAIGLGAFLFVFLIFMPRTIISFFTKEQSLIQNGFLPLQISMVMVPVIGLHLISYFYFMAVNKPVNALVISLFRQVLFLLPLIFIFPFFWGKNGLWIAFPVADALSAFVGFSMVLKAFFSIKGALAKEIPAV